MPSSPNSDLPPPANHVFVDFESVHQIDLIHSLIQAGHVTIDDKDAVTYVV